MLDLDGLYHRLELLTIGHDWRRSWAADAIRRYINTGRASLYWIRALDRVNLEKLLERMTAGGLSDDEMLSTCIKYLRRYGGLKKEDVHHD